MVIGSIQDVVIAGRPVIGNKKNILSENAKFSAMEGFVIETLNHLI